MPIQPGTRLGAYEVQDFIGQGAMGLVYRCYHNQLERTGAVKVLQGLAPDPDATARFRHEAQAIAQMRHPNILNVYDFGDFNGTPYMIVEYVPGGSLAGRMSQGQLDQATAVRYLRGIAAGLDYAHSHGVVHRDVKPANVLLEPDDTPVLADFGLAKLLQGSSLKSMTGVTTGTPAYMAPEQVSGSKVGPAADRYSLATIAYEMFTGAIPFDGEALLELLYAQVHREPPLPSSRNPALGSRVDAVVMRGLAKDPEARWPTCAAFVDALAAALSEASTPRVERTIAVTVPARAAWMRKLRPDATAAVASPPVATAPYPSPPAIPQPLAKAKSHRRRNVIAAAALIVIILAGVLAYALTHLQPSISLSSNPVVPGQQLVVTAAHLPADQSGVLRISSPPYDFPFRAGPAGNLTLEITVPRDIEFGDHIIELCWKEACHGQATLHVSRSVAVSSPPASPTPTPTPTLRPSPSPSSGASPRPSPTPTSSQPLITLKSPKIQYRIGKDTVYGFHYLPGRALTVWFGQTSTGTSARLGSATVGSNGDFNLAFSVPPSAQLGYAHVEVCGYNGCLSTNIDVTATG